MDLSYINPNAWQYFQTHYPDAYAYLLRSSLIGEYAALTCKAKRTKWETSRFNELKQLLDIAGGEESR